MEQQHFSRLEPQQTADVGRRTKRGAASRSQRFLELTLFGVVALLLLAGGIAVWSSLSSSWNDIPTTVDAGFERDRVNVLLIGVGGDTHPQGYDALADAIILASIKPSTGEVALVSIPRDLYVPVGTYGHHRINRAHAIGSETGFPGKGPGLLIDTVERITDQPVDAFVRVDFAAFVALVDALGGVEVTVDQPFHDYLFDEHFTAGPQRFDGRRALQYARSRYVLAGGEGDNFGRERRQQQILSALQSRVDELGASDFMKLIAIAPDVSRYTATNLKSSEILRLYRVAREVEPDEIRTVTLEPWVEDVFIRRVFDGGEAVAPRDGNLAPIQHAVRDVFESQTDAAGKLRTANRDSGPFPGRRGPILATIEVNHEQSSHDGSTLGRSRGGPHPHRRR